MGKKVNEVLKKVRVILNVAQTFDDTDMDKPLGKASRRTFGRIGTLIPFPCWKSLGVMSSGTLKFSKQPPSEALKGGLPVSVLQLSGLYERYRQIYSLLMILKEDGLQKDWE